MRGAVEAWGRARWPDATVIHEFPVGGCRVDLCFVCPDTIIGVEIKSSRDTLKRLPRQLKDYQAAFPEVWVAFATRWLSHFHGSEVPWNIGHLLVDQGNLTEDIPHYTDPFPHPAMRDLMLTAPMLWLAHKPEVQALLRSHGIYFKSRLRSPELMQLAARNLTGDQIVTGVCAAIRARAAGWEKSEPIQEVAA